jgi:methionyl-tRNA formyltransferase
MLKEILLLIGQPSQQVALTRLLHAHNPALSFRCVVTAEEMHAINPDSLRDTRLLAFTSGTIVPRHILKRLGHGAYNFHPGPPTYAGWAPAHFALYDGAKEFGATAHEMTDRVDAGPIVGIETFPIPEDIGIRELEKIAYVRLAYLFWRLARQLATHADPLPVLPVRWSGIKSTRQMYADMCRLPPNVTHQEIARRIRAFSDDFRGMYPTINIHGFDFRCVDAEPLDRPVALTMPDQPGPTLSVKRPPSVRMTGAASHPDLRIAHR